MSRTWHSACLTFCIMKTQRTTEFYAGLIVGVSVQWNKYPSHMTRQIRVTVGKLAVVDSPWSEESRSRACAALAAILHENETLCRELTGAIMEVVL